MESKEKTKNNYNIIISNLEKRLERIKHDKKVYNKLKKYIAFFSVIILAFGLWPLTLLGLLISAFALYEEQNKGKEYNNIITKIEDAYISLQASEEEKMQKEYSRSCGEQVEENNAREREVKKNNTDIDYPILQVLYGENDDKQVCRK